MNNINKRTNIIIGSSFTIYIYLFIINFFANITCYKLYPGLRTVLLVICISAFISYILTWLYNKLPYNIGRYLCYIYIIVLYILAIIDYFLIFKFGTIINQETTDIFAETNFRESIEFLKTYLNFPLIIFVCASVFIINLILWKLSSLHSLRRIFKVLLLMSFAGFLFLLCFAITRDTTVERYTNISRLVYSAHVINKRSSIYQHLAGLCASTKPNYKQEPFTMIVVIGESHSVYHSSLYGYQKNTNPYLMDRVKSGELIVFDNAISVADHTNAALPAIFSLNKNNEDFQSYPLFPAFFKNANYHSTLYDNEYLVGSDATFISNKNISDVLFDFRNNCMYEYDEELIDNINILDSPSLYIIHLKGQHYGYRSRYPKSFEHFSCTDYVLPSDESKRDIIASYDNATLYNDYILDKIINKFKEKESCMVYFSDHGEEVYEDENSVGHGFARSSKNLKYQIRIPMMLWLSPSLKKKRNDLYTRALKAQHLPITIDDISHTILDIAGFSSEWIDSTRSFMNPHFQPRKRKIFSNIDYDSKY